jgi:alpha-galactosidase
MNGIAGAEPYSFYGNVPDQGLITNLPAGACVEVPVWASKKGPEPVHVGALPAQCAALTGLSAQIEEMAVEAALTGDPRLVFQAIAHNPLTASVLALAEIRSMVNEMFEQNRAHLPQFRRFRA